MYEDLLKSLHEKERIMKDQADTIKKMHGEVGVLGARDMLQRLGWRGWLGW